MGDIRGLRSELSHGMDVIYGYNYLTSSLIATQNISKYDRSLSEIRLTGTNEVYYARALKTFNDNITTVKNLACWTK